MTDQQIRLLRWVSKVFELMGNPQCRNRFNGEQLDAICAFAKANVDANLMLVDTEWIPNIGQDKDIAELEKIFNL